VALLRPPAGYEESAVGLYRAVIGELHRVGLVADDLAWALWAAWSEAHDAERKALARTPDALVRLRRARQPTASAVAHTNVDTFSPGRGGARRVEHEQAETARAV